MNGDELDRILDEALASYSQEEPRAGLPARVMARVMARVRAEGSVSRGWWGLVLATAALACVAIAIRPRPVAIALPPVVTFVEPLPHPPHPDFTRRVAQARPIRRLPRRESFPSPAPLTPEERALIAFAQQAPVLAREFAQPDKPLEIEAIDVQPLQIDGLKTGEKQER